MLNCYFSISPGFFIYPLSLSFLNYSYCFIPWPLILFFFSVPLRFSLSSVVFPLFLFLCVFSSVVFPLFLFLCFFSSVSLPLFLFLCVFFLCLSFRYSSNSIPLFLFLFLQSFSSIPLFFFLYTALNEQ